MVSPEVLAQPNLASRLLHSKTGIFVCELVASVGLIAGCGGQTLSTQQSEVTAVVGTAAPGGTNSLETTSTTGVSTSTILPTTTTAPNVAVRSVDFNNRTYTAGTCDLGTGPWQVANGTTTQKSPRGIDTELTVKKVSYGDVNHDGQEDAAVLLECREERTTFEQIVGVYSVRGADVEQIGLTKIPVEEEAIDMSVASDGVVQVAETANQTVSYVWDEPARNIVRKAADAPSSTATTPETVGGQSNKEISDAGIGPLQIGMDQSEVTAKGYTIAPACGNYATLKGTDGSNMMARLVEDHVAGLAVDSSDYVTKSGVKIGDPESVVTSKYGQNLKPGKEANDGMGNYTYRFESPQFKKINLQLLFNISGGKLDSINLVAVGGEPMFC